MVDLFVQTFSSLKTASEIAKALLGLRDARLIADNIEELRMKLSDANSLILQAQSNHAAVLQEKADLKKQLVELVQWENEKQRYQLIEPWNGTFVYALKAASKGTDPAHWICEHCFQDRRKSILQNTYKNGNESIVFMKCPHCGVEHRPPRDSHRRHYV